MSGSLYSLDEAQALLPEARAKLDEVIALVAELQQLVVRVQEGTAPRGAVEDVATLEATVDEAFAWFERRGVQVKGLSPALLDFPARAIRNGAPLDVLLCWRDDEDAIAYYHRIESGYGGREPVALLDTV